MSEAIGKANKKSDSQRKPSSTEQIFGKPVLSQGTPHYRTFWSAVKKDLD